MVVTRVVVGVNPRKLFKLALAFLDQRGQHVCRTADFDLNRFILFEETLAYSLLLQLSKLNHYRLRWHDQLTLAIDLFKVLLDFLLDINEQRRQALLHPFVP